MCSNYIKNPKFYWLIKIFLVAVFACYIYYRLFVNRSFIDLWQSFHKDHGIGSYAYLIICILLMPINWMLESIKWQWLMQHFTKLDFKTSFQGVLAGLSLGVITPQRIGEYGGRMLIVPADQKLNTVVTTLISSIAQNLVTLTFGVIGLTFFYQQFYLGSRDFDWFWVVLLAALCVGVWIYFNLRWFIDLLQKSSFGLLQKLGNRCQGIHTINKQKLLIILLLAATRYGVYLLQYILILLFFSIEMSIMSMICGISSIFLIQSGVPLPPVLNLMARGEIAIFIWSFFDINELVILLATFSLWMINLVFPALLGIVIVLRTNIQKSFESKT